MKIVINLLAGITLVILTLPVILVYVNTHPPRYPLHITPSRYHASYETVAFESEDGTELKGWLVKPDAPRPESPAVIICHGVGANKSDFTDLAVSLSGRGYSVLLFDFRAHGDSGGRRTSLGGLLEQKDIAAAGGFVRARAEIDSERIGIYGFSMGASAAILAAAGSPVFSAVVADSPFTSLRDQARLAITGFYRLPSFPFLYLAVAGYEIYFQTDVDKVAPARVIHEVSAPVFIIANDGDQFVPAESGRKLYAAAGEPKELWIIHGAGHGASLASAGSEYEKRVGEFFDRYLK